MINAAKIKIADFCKYNWSDRLELARPGFYKNIVKPATFSVNEPVK